MKLKPPAYINLKILQTVNFLENVSKKWVAMQLNIDKQCASLLQLQRFWTHF